MELDSAVAAVVCSVVLPRNADVTKLVLAFVGEGTTVVLSNITVVDSTGFSVVNGTVVDMALSLGVGAVEVNSAVLVCSAGDVCSVGTLLEVALPVVEEVMSAVVFPNIAVVSTGSKVVVSAVDDVATFLVVGAV